jgi:hypothetical protein
MFVAADIVKASNIMCRYVYNFPTKRHLPAGVVRYVYALKRKVQQFHASKFPYSPRVYYRTSHQDLTVSTAIVALGLQSHTSIVLLLKNCNKL